MPAKSRRQLRAMYAAASGKSTLGIPNKVAKKFIKATSKRMRKKLMSKRKGR